MVEYIIVLLVLLYGCIHYDVKGNLDTKNRWLYFEWLVLVLLAGLRYKVGGDSIAYYNEFYSQWPTLSEVGTYDNERYNILWIYFIAICKSIIDEFWFLQIVHAVIVNTVFFRFFKKHTTYIYTAILFYFILYFFRYNTEVLRASLAVCSFLIGFESLSKKKWIYYFTCCLVAYGFHSEAIVTFFFPLILPLQKIRITGFSVAMILAVTIVLLFSINLIPFVGSLLGSGKFGEAFAYYSNTNANVSAIGYIYSFITQLPFLYMLWQYKYRESDIFKAFCIFYVVVAIQSLNYSNLISRSMDFVYPLMLVLLVNSFKKPLYEATGIRKDNNIEMGVIIFILLFGVVRYFAVDNHWYLFYPYYSIFNPTEVPFREQIFYDIFN